jgi:hypothetical protein
VDDRGAGQARAVQAPPGLEQDGLAPARPQRLGRGLLEAGRAGAQRVGEQRLPAVGGPCLQQRPRRRPRRLVPHRLGRGRPGRRLHDRVHLHRAGGAGRVDGQQAGALQAAQGAAAALGVGRIAVAVPRDELARRRGAEHVAGDPVAVEQDGQCEALLGQPARQELVGLLDRQRPRDRLGGGLAAERPGDLILPAREKIPVIAAGQPGIGDRGAGLGERERLPAQVLKQVDRPDPLVRIGAQPRHEVGQGLM